MAQGHVLAGVRQHLVAKLRAASARVFDDRSCDSTSACIQKGARKAQVLRDFIEDVKASGFVARRLRSRRARVSIAPAAAR